MWETVVGVVLGGLATFLPTWFLSNKARKEVLEDRKRDREIAAREIRLKEGEEKIKELSSLVDHFERMLGLLFNEKDESDLRIVNDLMRGYVKKNEEMDKGTTINQVSITSLGDEQLTKTFTKVSGSYADFSLFYVELLRLFLSKGFTEMQKESPKHIEKESVLMQSYVSSVEGFLKRVTELRSQ